MAILSGYSKVKDRILTSSGYKLLSRWTSSNTVDFDDGKTAQTKLGAINGIVKDSSSLSTVTDSSFAAGAVAVKEALADVNGKLSKLLWKGTFTNGSITVPNFSKYRYFLVNVNGVICYGNRNYGIGGYLEYGSYAVRFYGYRFSVKENSDIVSITDLEKGGSNGQENVPITEIYGVF